MNNCKAKQLRKKLRNNSTPQEIVLWSRLKRKQLGYKFRRQHSFGKYIVDFYCKEKGLVIEIDGCQHKKDLHQNYDTERTEYLQRKGLKVLRFWNNEINNNLDGVIFKILESLK
ncbi:MAG: endonuclease domain-containing protein [Candidatus Moranbacteria bacterium]|nr:endonuclease domain-containing protein [Candidatus Moranbacteria bacterium]